MIPLNDNGTVNARDIYNYTGLKTRFNDWINKSLNFIDAIEGKDFYCQNSKSTGGRPKIDYELTLDCAKEVCLVQPTMKGKELRQWLISISKQKESGELVTHEQVIAVIRMIKIFSIYEFRKLALKKHTDGYVNLALAIHPEYSKSTGKLYAAFHSWRNEVLQTGRDVLAQRVKEYCLIEQKRIPASFTQDEALTMMGQYEQIKNAIWDLLSSQGKSQEMINNICSLASQLAKEIRPFLERLNQSNLFFTAIEDKEVKQIGLK